MGPVESGRGSTKGMFPSPFLTAVGLSLTASPSPHLSITYPCNSSFCRSPVIPNQNCERACSKGQCEKLEQQWCQLPPRRISPSLRSTSTRRTAISPTQCATAPRLRHIPGATRIRRPFNVDVSCELAAWM